MSKPSASQASTIHFFFEKKGATLTNRTQLKEFIGSIFKREKKKIPNLNYIFVSDKRLLEINRQYLLHDFYTDIITFDLSTVHSSEAEIYISIDRVKDNAQKLGVSFRSEIHRVIFHGALHLCGYKDKTKEQSKKMREKEDAYLNSYFSEI